MSHNPPPDPNLADLAAATPEEIAEALSYELRYDKPGKPRRCGWDFTAGLAADHLAEHLRCFSFVIMRARSSRQHSAG